MSRPRGRRPHRSRRAPPGRRALFHLSGCATLDVEHLGVLLAPCSSTRILRSSVMPDAHLPGTGCSSAAAREERTPQSRRWFSEETRGCSPEHLRFVKRSPDDLEKHRALERVVELGGSYCFVLANVHDFEPLDACHSSPWPVSENGQGITGGEIGNAAGVCSSEVLSDPATALHLDHDHGPMR